MVRLTKDILTVRLTGIPDKKLTFLISVFFILNNMNVLSLFNGMSCGWIALKELNIKVNKYYSSEIDKYANEQTRLNDPDTIHLGDVTKWREWDIDWQSINLVLAGSPCQGFSFAGKQLAFDDPRSKLFFVFVEILNHIKKLNPDVKFLLENVNMKKEYLRVISEYVGVFPVNINSNLVSAQNRDRWYWTNIRTKKVGLFDEIYTDIPQPKDRGILLKDILENDVSDKYYLSDKMLNYFDKRADNFNNGKVNIREENDKESCITASCKSVDISDNFVKTDRKGNVSPNQNKASCFTAGAHSGGNHSDMDLICIQQRAHGFNKGGLHFDKSPTIQASHDWAGNNVLMTKNYLQYDISGKGYKSQQDRAFYEDGKMGCVPSARTESKINILTQNRIRRLTPTECARLQTIPDWYKWECSDTQIYRMCGNGWTVAVIAHILSFLEKD